MDQLATLLRTHTVVGCTAPHCPGILVARGRIITRRSTAESGATYAFQVARQARKRSLPPVEYFVDEEEDDGPVVSKPIKRQKAQDDDWAPPEQYTPAMRFTRQSMETNLRKKAPTGLTLKHVAQSKITAAVYGERSKCTNTPMGKVSAWSHAKKHGAPNAGRYTPASQNHYEWCHLQGVSLGGYTLASNLVAGHYALNTYMSVVEEHLRGKTAFAVDIQVHCSAPDVADFIVYAIYRDHDKKLMKKLNMDGRMKCFSALDRIRVKQDLKSAGL
ncbi:hypothetical protein KQ945_00890 [Bacillus subtilis subsp. subtilis]|nr:hypothetical protein [Bacillus subtilis subsp. subtilis]